jgi:hypothetical protein
MFVQWSDTKKKKCIQAKKKNATIREKEIITVGLLKN